jgi:hypothetical protein
MIPAFPQAAFAVHLPPLVSSPTPENFSLRQVLVMCNYAFMFQYFVTIIT